jgi:hypothetical protein
LRFVLSRRRMCGEWLTKPHQSALDANRNPSAV